MNNSKKLKAIVLSMGLGVATLASTPVQAQMVDQWGNGLFQWNSLNYGLMQSDNGLFYGNSQNYGLMQRGGIRSGGSTLFNESFGAAGSQISNEAFGDTAPLGGGIGILLVAGMGYAFIQSKKNKQN